MDNRKSGPGVNPCIPANQARHTEIFSFGAIGEGLQIAVSNWAFKTMKTENYMLIGDFNFGDYDVKEQNLLEKYKYQIHDLWKDIYDLDEVNPIRCIRFFRIINIMSF